MSFFKKQIIFDEDLIPKHIAIIMDGNGTWAKKRGLPRSAGHKKGAERIFDLADSCKKLDIKYVTIYAFSTENWKRKKEEIDYIFSLAEDAFTNEFTKFKNENIKVMVSGNLDRLDGEYDSLKSKILEVINDTKNNTGLCLNIAFNYGGHDEIVSATKKISNDVKEGKINVSQINEELFNSYLFTRDLPDVDLMIRTSGEKRLSNFLLWQIAYAELIFTPTLWPDFDYYELEKCIKEYQKRDRRFGNVK